MEQSLTMHAFQQSLESESDDPLAKILRELAEIKDIAQVSNVLDGPQPLGVWSGWSY